MSRYVILRELGVSHAPFGARRGAGPGSLGTNRGFSLEVEALSSRDRADLATDPAVRAVARVMPTRLIRPLAGSTNALMHEAWGLASVGATTSNWDGTDVLVSVLDTGIDREHAAFAGVNLVEKDFTGGANGDRAGHGTHCAGIMFGRSVNGVRIGVALGVQRALIGKVLNDDGVGTSDTTFAGIRWAHSLGAQVISMSLGFDFPGMTRDLVIDGWPVELAASSALEAYASNLRMFDALMSVLRASEAFTGGSVVVAAAGNESRRNLDPRFEIAASLPSAAQDVVSVGALFKVGEAYDVASFSNTLPLLSAPGVDIISAAIGGGLVSMSGTSMASPHVAGVAALWWQAVRHQALPYNSRTVLIRMQAAARVDCFAPHVEVAARGLGLISAP